MVQAPIQQRVKCLYLEFRYGYSYTEQTVVASLQFVCTLSQSVPATIETSLRHCCVIFYICRTVFSERCREPFFREAPRLSCKLHTSEPYCTKHYSQPLFFERCDAGGKYSSLSTEVESEVVLLSFTETDFYVFIPSAINYFF